jgi:hypothetical protein
MGRKKENAAHIDRAEIELFGHIEFVRNCSIRLDRGLAIQWFAEALEGPRAAWQAGARCRRSRAATLRGVLRLVVRKRLVLDLDGRMRDARRPSKAAYG